jgi:hypothetical protein
MLIGNYEVHTPRDPGHSWMWEVRQCGLDQVTYTPDCVHVNATPRPNGQATPWIGCPPLTIRSVPVVATGPHMRPTPTTEW